ncbi:site-specific DNA-methyltransferase (adenine-specific) [Evansella caseinilytica]|uniref:Site-specific DNA-methyltransferase (Adenine-specific) n=1 Tax=Evansella caseinilytica TaxID=1503961 RepID=A0A1H3RQN4_9BACI|nr:class I SAM-dependent methyltransferase [Evansella caseinilytica]SDZ28084.1 site-specific DNA-methyltransferase (adenine-specific) [Evansella caseinilytica]
MRNASTNTEKIFSVLDKGSVIIEKARNIIYLEALSEMGEALYQGGVPDGFPEEKKQELVALMKELPDHETIAKEEYRRAVQLAMLKGMKNGAQPHHAMTPDAICLLVGYLVNKIFASENKERTLTVLDPAVGTGNLLTAVINQAQRRIHGIGMEPDEMLLKLAYVNANLQEQEVDLFHQDSIASPLIKNVDAIVSDLPAGYYPNDAVAQQFHLAAESGHSFVHFLLLEQSLKFVKPGGFLIFIVPNFLFAAEDSQHLHEYIKGESYIYSLLQLPRSMFKNKDWGKSILILRKRKEGIQGPKQALLADLPSFSNDAALQDMLQRISGWFDQQSL